MNILPTQNNTGMPIPTEGPMMPSLRPPLSQQTQIGQSMVPQKPAGNTYSVPGRNVSFTDDDLAVLKPVLYGELSNRPVDKQELESRVILNTAFNRMAAYAKAGMPKTLAEVLAMPNQYQAYGGKQYQNYASTTLSGQDAQKKNNVDQIVSKLVDENKNNLFKDNTQNSYFYKHIGNNPNTATIQYNNTRPLFAKSKK